MSDTRILAKWEPSAPVVRIGRTRAHTRTSRRDWLDRVSLLMVVLGWMALGLRLAADEVERRLEPGPLPGVGAMDVYHLFVDDRPVWLSTTAAWQKVPYTATRDAVRTDVTLWLRMHFDDWDTVPTELRIEGLNAMCERYRFLIASPDAWDRMGPTDWDKVPQPIRAMAFLHMVEYWSGYYQVGAAFGIPRQTVSDTLAAIVMSESWFDHRAVNVNRWGNRDLGVAQASDRARRRMVAWHSVGAVDILFSDDDYFDPWKGTRFVALWMGLLLEEVGGDLDRAVRAYHRGVAREADATGQKYLETVKQRRNRFIRNEGNSRTWDYLWRRNLVIGDEACRWLHRSQSASRPLEGATGVAETAASRRALIQAGTIARWYGADLGVVHAVGPEASATLPSTGTAGAQAGLAAHEAPACSVVRFDDPPRGTAGHVPRTHRAASADLGRPSPNRSEEVCDGLPHDRVGVRSERSQRLEHLGVSRGERFKGEGRAPPHETIWGRQRGRQGLQGLPVAGSQIFQDLSAGPRHVGIPLVGGHGNEALYVQARSGACSQRPQQGHLDVSRRGSIHLAQSVGV